MITLSFKSVEDGSVELLCDYSNNQSETLNFFKAIKQMGIRGEQVIEEEAHRLHRLHNPRNDKKGVSLNDCRCMVDMEVILDKIHFLKK